MFQTFTGKEYLMIDIANNFGLDKEDWNSRINWFKANEFRLDALLKQAEEPALFFAGSQAWKKVQRGETVHYPISLDATSSGIQILAALTGDRKAASLCNLVDTGHREDAYTGLYEAMLREIGEDATIDRKDTKQAVMTSFYNSTAVPKAVFGEGELLDIFYKTMEENAPYAWELNETMLKIWDPTKYSNDWVLPDNFHVHIKVMDSVTDRIHFLNTPYDVVYSVNQPMEQGRSLGANMTHSIDGMVVREMARRCMYNVETVQNIQFLIGSKHTSSKYSEFPRHKDKMVKILHNHYRITGFYSARILDYVDEHNIDMTNYKALNNLIQSLPNKPFEILSVHDCFRCLPNYGNDLRRQYNQIISDIAKSNLLQNILSQIIGRDIKINKADPNLWKDILDANYALS